MLVWVFLIFTVGASHASNQRFGEMDEDFPMDLYPGARQESFEYKPMIIEEPNIAPKRSKSNPNLRIDFTSHSEEMFEVPTIPDEPMQSQSMETRKPIMPEQPSNEIYMRPKLTEAPKPFMPKEPFRQMPMQPQPTKAPKPFMLEERLVQIPMQPQPTKAPKPFMPEKPLVQIPMQPQPTRAPKPFMSEKPFRQMPMQPQPTKAPKPFMPKEPLRQIHMQAQPTKAPKPFMPVQPFSQIPMQPLTTEAPKPFMPEQPFRPIPMKPQPTEAPKPIIPEQPSRPIPMPGQPTKPWKTILPERPPRPSQNIIDNGLVMCEEGRYESNKCIEDVWSYRIDTTMHSDIPPNTWIKKTTKREGKKLMKKYKHLFKNREVWTFENEISKLPFYLKSLPVLRRGSRLIKPNFLVPSDEPLRLYIDVIQVKSSQFLQSWNVTKVGQVNSNSACNDNQEPVDHTCYKKGYYPNFRISTCSQFVFCDNTLEGVLFPSFATCPENTSFDPNLKVCSTRYKCRN